MEEPYMDGLTSIMHLPDDCLSSIFQWLDCGFDRESFGLTCHRWLHIQNLSRRSLQFQCSFSQLNLSSMSQPNIRINSFHFYRMLSRFQHLQSLSLSGCTELRDSSLAHLQLYGSKLQALYMDCCFGISDYGFFLVGTGCPSLTVISLYRSNITDEGLETLATACSALKDVNLSYCSLISDRGLSALSQGCHQILAIKISSCRGLSGIGFRGCSPTLSYIDAESCKLEPNGIMDIVSGGGLEFLNVAGVSLFLRGNDLAAIGTGLATRLKVLNFRMCRTVGDESIVSIAKGCPLLEEWNIALCHEINISGWQAIGSNCHSLKKLHVNRCWNLCDLGLQALRDGCKQLSTLYMNHCPRISHTAMELFKCYRGNVEIKEEEIMCTGLDWTSR